MAAQEPPLTNVKTRTLIWFGHVALHDSLSKTILLGTLEVDGAVVGRENAGWTTSKSGHPYPRPKHAHTGLLQERLVGDLC